MTRRQLSDSTLVKCRVVMQGGAILHLVARGEPELVRVEDHLIRVDADWVVGADVDAGDTLGYVDWSQVVAVTWRREGADATASRALDRRAAGGKA